MGEVVYFIAYVVLQDEKFFSSAVFALKRAVENSRHLRLVEKKIAKELGEAIAPENVRIVNLRPLSSAAGIAPAEAGELTPHFVGYIHGKEATEGSVVIDGPDMTDGGSLAVVEALTREMAGYNDDEPLRVLTYERL